MYISIYKDISVFLIDFLTYHRKLSWDDIDIFLPMRQLR